MEPLGKITQLPPKIADVLALTMCVFSVWAGNVRILLLKT